MDDLIDYLDDMLSIQEDITEPTEYSSLTNDEDRIKCAMRYMLKNDLVPDIIFQSKQAFPATSYIEYGNQLAESGKVIESMTVYSKAINYAPSGSKEACQALISRAKMLLQLGLYERHVEDIDRIIKFGCPDAGKSSLYLCRAKALLAIDSTMRSEVEKTLAECRKWIHATDVAGQQKVKEALKRIMIKDQPSTPFPIWDHKRFLPKTPEDNSKIAQASNAIELEYSDEFGRHVVATRDINAGEALLVHRAYAALPNNYMYNEQTNKFTGTLYEFCGNCTQRCYGGIGCPKCVNVIYCNEKCRDKAWKEHHDIECPVICNMLAANMTTPQLMSLRLTVKAFKEAGTFQALKDKLKKVNSLTDPMARGFDRDVFDGSKYASIHTLLNDLTNIPVPFKYALECARILTFLAETTGTLGAKKNNFKDLMKHKLAPFVGALLLNNMKIHVMHTVKVFTRRGEPESRLRTDAMLPFVSLFNHSCDPMTCMYTSGDMTALIAVRMIKKGEQIFMCRGSHFREQTTENRRTELQETRGFLCRCTACMSNWSATTHFPSCLEQNLSSDVKAKFNRIKKKTVKYTSLMVYDIDETYKFIEGLKEMLNSYGEYATYPCEEIVGLETALYKVYYRIFR